MKKSYALLAITALLGNYAHAQLAKKYVMFEHFTQASCGPCAQQNPAFQDNILAKNKGKIHHIAFHTSFPGKDPMYDMTKTQINSKQSFYPINAVPTMKMLGTHYSGSPANVSQDAVDKEIALGSPAKIEVSQVNTGSNLNISVNVTAINDIPTADYNLLVAVVEKTVVYASAPGTNGEKRFPNVFRKMLTDMNGDAFVVPTKGGNKSLNFTVALDPAWKSDSIYTIAYIQNTSKEVLNSGSSLDPVSQITYGDLQLIGKPFQAGTSKNTFAVLLQNKGTTAEKYQIDFSKDIPADWSANYTIDGVNYTQGQQITIPAGGSVEAPISIVPGTTPYVGECTIAMHSVDNTATLTLTKTVRVINGVTDLVVSNVAGRGDGKPGSAKDWEKLYMDGLNYANNTKHASTNSDALVQAIDAAALNGVKNIYYNVGFTFPAVTDELVNSLKSFLDKGGNMFIAGQDIGWEINDANSSNTNQLRKDFYKEYLKAVYKADGTTSNSNFIPEANDIFAGTTTTTVFDYYGGGNMYPDELGVVPNVKNSNPIFYYNTAKSKIAGIRSYDDTRKSKIVYIAVGPEMLKSDDSKSQVIKTSHDWFYSTSGVADLNSDKSIEMGDCFPNPTTLATSITLNNLHKDATLKIVDVQGKVVYSQLVFAGTDKVNINTSDLNAGVYFYELVVDQQMVATKKLTIIK